MTTKFKAGETYQLEADSVYVQVVVNMSDPKATIGFKIINTLEQSDDEEKNHMSNMVAYLARGMIDVSASNPEEVMEAGVTAFMRDSGAFDEDKGTGDILDGGSAIIEAAAGGNGDDDDGVKPGSVPFVYSRDYKLTTETETVGKA
jgi:hypothetical protein